LILYFILAYLLTGIIWFLRVLSVMIIINAFLSWFVDMNHPIREFVSRFVNPVVRPFRKLTDRLPSSHIPIDISPLLAYFAIMLIIQLLSGMYGFLRNLAIWY